MKRLFCGGLDGAAEGRALGGAAADGGKGTGGSVCREFKKKKHIVSISALKMWFSHCPNIA